MMGRLDGKVAIVTGASRGTGESTARLFVEEGARVVLADVLDDLGAVVARDLGSNAAFEHLDVTSEPQWQAAVEATNRRFGGVDILVNNAAVLLMAAIEDTELEDFERVVRVNQTGTFLGIKSVAGVMKAAKRGSIVNIASIDGQTAKNGLVAYASSKWAVRGITRVAALELGKFGIRVNAVCPESGSTAMIAPYVPAGIDLEKATSFSQPHLAPQRKRSTAEKIRDVAKIVVFLASDDSASCTGADFTVDGGNLAGSVIRGTPGA
jgi:3alpha(or 20beta)-hydroxysteroid dehydrogenase